MAPPQPLLALTNCDPLRGEVERTARVKAGELPASDEFEAATWYNDMVVVVFTVLPPEDQLQELLGAILFLQTKDRSRRVHHVVAIAAAGARWRSSAGDQELEQHTHLVERLRGLAAVRRASSGEVAPPAPT